jgi:hypothetical protein
MNLKRPGRWPARSISFCSSLSSRQRLWRVLLGAREFDRPIIRAAEVSVQEAVQFDGRALKSGRAPYEAPPWHSVVFLFHRFWPFLILDRSVPWRSIESDAFVHRTQQLKRGAAPLDADPGSSRAPVQGGAIPCHARLPANPEFMRHGRHSSRRLKGSGWSSAPASGTVCSFSSLAGRRAGRQREGISQCITTA